MSATTAGLITSRGEFHDALREGFAQAAAVGCRELWLCDRDFAEWPLGERGVVEHLTQWAGAHRRLTLVASSFDEVARKHSRWVQWRQSWSHVVHCRINAEVEQGLFPTLLLAPGVVCVTLSDPVHFRGRQSRDEADAVRCRERIDAVLQRSEESFPATTTGL